MSSVAMSTVATPAVMSATVVSNDKAAQALELLSHLPDFNEELFIQLGDPLDTFTFTCFPDLPFELRIKIWRLSFPRDREFSIGLELIYHHADVSMHPLAKAAEKKRNNAKAQLPATLFVNRESRNETLPNYMIVLPEEFLGYKVKFGGEFGGSPPLCFNPHLDMPYVTLPSLKNSLNHTWFEYLGEMHPEVVESIKHLKVRQWRYKLDVHQNWEEEEEYATLETYREEYLSQFLQLTSLEEITFIQDYDEYAAETPDSRRELSLELVNYFEEHEDEFSGGPPSFTIQQEKRHEHAH